LNFTPAAAWNISKVRCDVEPLPCDATLTLPSFALACATNSATVFTLSLLLTAMTFGVEARMLMGSNFCGSNCSFEYRFSLTTSGGGGEDSSV